MECDEIERCFFFVVRFVYFTSKEMTKSCEKKLCNSGCLYQI